MLTYSDVLAFASAGLTALHTGDVTYVLPSFSPGPPALAIALKKAGPGQVVMLTVGNGLPDVHEGLFTQPFIVCRAIGVQGSYEDAETLSQDLDGIFTEVGSVRASMMGSTRVIAVSRNAPPQLVDYDDSRRYHFQTTYIAEATR